MKQLFKTLALATILSCSALAIQAQEVNSTSMLEMAPYRHIINPAWEPLTDGYFYFPFLSHINFNAGNNSLTMSDIIFNQNGTTMWALNPASNRDLMSAFRKTTLIRADASFAILGFGFRLKNDAYLHINIDGNADLGIGLPKDLFGFVLGGGMKDLNGLNTYKLNGLGLAAQAYLALGVGYSKQQNDQWNWGFKVKLLDGIAYAGMRNKNLDLTASPEEWALKGNGYLQMAGPFASMPASIEADDIQNWREGDILPTDWKAYLKPSGYGMAFDLGATYQPIKQVKISLSLTDLGAIYWRNGNRYAYNVNGVFNGIGEIQYDEYVNDGKFDTNALKDTITTRLKNVYETALTADGEVKNGFMAPLTMKLNAGVDAYLCNNIIGLGLYSRTMLYNAKIYEEITLGAAVRPASWFNFALSYSFLNGKWNNLGAAIGLRGGPFVLTLAADYVPMTYAHYSPDEGRNIAIPYKAKGLNLEMGLNIVWGWKNHDKDKDGVLDKLDMCLNTPKEINGLKVEVDALGCPKDEDGDGVPDCQDECPGTPYQAYGLIDTKGCPIDTDGDGVPDYLDECPGTLPEVYGFVDEKGCALDSDGDGVPDYKDECPNTPTEAIGYTDEKGCTLDTDGDGVPDYLDECPNTPAEAIGYIDEKGCELDSDGDGVPDWKDECPNTVAAAIGHVDDKGCELDTDGDGVPDYQDMCPDVAGSAKNKGCPEEKKEVVNIFKKAMQGIQFETGKAVIKKTSYPILDQVAKVFLDNPTYYAEVQGHTDNVGKPEANKALSQARAESVREYLIGKGVEAERLTAMGYGDERPIADNSTKAGKAQNRRVEFAIEYKEVHTETILLYADPDPVDSVANDSTNIVEPMAAPAE